MGRLERDPKGIVKYSGGLVSDIEWVGSVTCKLSMVEDMVLDLGYSSIKGVYWLVPGLGLDNGLRLLVTDEDVANMCDAAFDNDNMVHLYVEHNVIADLIVIEQVVVSDNTQEADTEFVEADDVVVDQPKREQNDVSNEVQGAGSGQQRTSRRHHSRPFPLGQRIIPPREENEAPSVVVPQPNADGSDNEPDEYQYHSEELHIPPASDSEEEHVVFPQHNSDTPYGRIRLELGMEFATME
ncbi:hypothetical protein PIB30_062344 [Stylosanthes scabra]|uniref:PB1-like domain-containing protein n=1 Tax=Stylosanthes scabra TaxID=79078 RepID=A0ABU6XMN4_9FABA|nr:hypothetical protein [Stylosanthes scabra]